MKSSTVVNKSHLKQFLRGQLTTEQLGYSETPEEPTTRVRRVKGVIYISCDGMEKTLTEWSHYTGVKRDTLYRRLKRGWSIEDVLFRPVKSSQVNDRKLAHLFFQTLMENPNPNSCSELPLPFEADLAQYERAAS